jgi:KRAB domain-containing zinc finger protein
MLRHITEIHEGRKYECADCQEKFNRQENLDRHMIESHKEAEYKCTQCDDKFTRKENLERHIRNQHNNGKFKCKECNVILRNKEELADHQKTHLQYSLCSQTFTSKFNLRRHFKASHETTLLYECLRPNCEKKFGQKSNQERHSKSCKN